MKKITFHIANQTKPKTVKDVVNTVVISLNTNAFTLAALVVLNSSNRELIYFHTVALFKIPAQNHQFLNTLMMDG
jgi:hypothetical protein